MPGSVCGTREKVVSKIDKFLRFWFLKSTLMRKETFIVKIKLGK